MEDNLTLCPTCGAKIDIPSKIVYTKVGKMTTGDFAKKACFFSGKKTCINPDKQTANKKCSWPTFAGLDKKSEKVLRGEAVRDDYMGLVDLFDIIEEDIEYLKKPGEERYPDL